MLLKITNKHVPTSVSTAAQTSGCPAMANPTMAALVEIDIITFSMTFLLTFLANRAVLGILWMSFDIRMIPPVSVASAEPETPMEIPISAVASAGASFTPSPIMAVGPFFCNSVMILDLSSGRSSA